MSDNGHSNWNGFTRGTSEGAWSKVPSGNMKYECAGTILYATPPSEAYRDGWERIFRAKCEATHPETGVRCEHLKDPPHGKSGHQAGDAMWTDDGWSGTLVEPAP